MRLSTRIGAVVMEVLVDQKLDQQLRLLYGDQSFFKGKPLKAGQLALVGVKRQVVSKSIYRKCGPHGP